MLKIEDIGLLKITKCKDWAVYFTYDTEAYLLHGSSDGGESSITLYKRNLTPNGNYDLEAIKSNWGSSYLLHNYIDYKKPLVYSQIDTTKFVVRLVKNKLAECDLISINDQTEYDKRVMEKIQEHEKEIQRLRGELL